MASIYYLNQPSRPFWDFVSSLEDLPFFAPLFHGPSPHHPHPHFHPHGHHGHGPGPRHEDFQERSANVNEGAHPHQAAAGSDNEVVQDNTPPADNAARPTRSLGENAREQSPEGFRAGRGCRGRHGRRHDGSHGREHPFGGCPAGFGPGPGRGRGRDGPHHHRGSGRGWGHHPRGRFGAPPHFCSGGPFDLHSFLERLESQLGIDLDQMWRRYNQSDDQQVDFVPRADVFDTASEYLVHVSLPGAQKPDISVNYDAEESVLHLAGVVYRPGINEELNDALVIDERSREIGVFERSVRLGTRSEPANVDLDRISAKLADGILVVRLPKVPVDPERLRRRVSVEALDDKNDKQATVDDEPDDESDAMHLDSETEKGDFTEDLDTTVVGEATITQASEDGDYDDEGKEYVKVDVK
ncbi:hypothetical protein VTN77DRAFT_9726 [Rasamsonia byssochlamydoides]|uniref:uncharacterized protein n=1 Tax=Rasamsonia byssochlamydoides TaxID=89139 RepID=UPI003742FCA8